VVRWDAGSADGALRGDPLPLGRDCGKWFDPKGFAEGPFGLWQVVETEPPGAGSWEQRNESRSELGAGSWELGAENSGQRIADSG
jgi:hypothetical protein